MPVERLSLFQWHLSKSAFERMVPPWVDLACHGKLPDPSDLKIPFDVILKKGGIKWSWKLAHTQFVWGQMFEDTQLKGPFKSWKHSHRFLSGEGDQSFLEDEIECELGLGLDHWIEEKIKISLQYRHELLKSDLAFLKHYPDKKLKVLISGATGLIGAMLKAFLSCAGHDVWTLTRKQDLEEKQIFWDPSNGQLQTKDLEGFDAIIHLAGASVGSLIWTEDVRKKITLSRVHSTWLLSKAISRLQKPPEVLIFASGIGYYGSKFSGVDEDSPKGSGFMSDLAADIEKSALATNGTCRVVPLRLGAVLSMKGGYLAKMLSIASCYGKLSTGNPNRNIAWIDREDVIRGIYHLLFNQDLRGPVNLVSPSKTTEELFWEELGHSMGKNFLFPLPASLIRKVNQTLYDELLAADQGEISSKLFRSNYQFANPGIKDALKYCSEYLF